MTAPAAEAGIGSAFRTQQGRPLGTRALESALRDLASPARSGTLDAVIDTNWWIRRIGDAAARRKARRGAHERVAGGAWRGRWPSVARNRPVRRLSGRPAFSAGLEKFRPQIVEALGGSALPGRHSGEERRRHARA